MYVPKKLIGHFGPDCHYLKKHTLDKICFYNPKITLWHSTYQLSHYMPIRTPVIQTIHDLNFLFENPSPARISKYTKRIDRNLKRLSHIIAISEFTKQELLCHFNIDIPIDVIYNGCNEYTGEVLEPIRKPQRPFLFTIGTVIPKKNFHVLPCLLQGNNYELIIAGICNKEYVREIIKEAHVWKVEDRIHLIGAITEPEKHWYLQNCKAFLFPSIAEGFGLPVIEAMQYGKPVFISDHTCLPEIGGEFAYYFNHDFDRHKMQQEFENGLDDFEKGGKNPSQIKEHALSFSWETAAKKYWEIYKQFGSPQK